MREGPPQSLHHAELRFFATVTASLSHQINNVLTIIGELNGLSEDLLASGQAGEAPVSRLAETAARINDNLARCVEYLRVLNRFAHSCDHEQASCDLKQLAVLLQSITRRFLELRKATLELELPAEEVILLARPFALLHVLFLAVRAALPAAEGGGTVRLSLGNVRDHVEMRVSTAGSQSEDNADDLELKTLVAACQKLGIAVVSTGPTAFPMRLLLPRDSSEPIEMEAR